jgi:hypothetical protein
MQLDAYSELQRILSPSQLQRPVSLGESAQIDETNTHLRAFFSFPIKDQRAALFKFLDESERISGNDKSTEEQIVAWDLGKLGTLSLAEDRDNVLQDVPFLKPSEKLPGVKPDRRAALAYKRTLGPWRNPRYTQDIRIMVELGRFDWPSNEWPAERRIFWDLPGYDEIIELTDKPGEGEALSRLDRQVEKYSELPVELQRRSLRAFLRDAYVQLLTGSHRVVSPLPYQSAGWDPSKLDVIALAVKHKLFYVTARNASVLAYSPARGFYRTASTLYQKDRIPTVVLTKQMLSDAVRRAMSGYYDVKPVSFPSKRGLPSG